MKKISLNNAKQNIQNVTVGTDVKIYDFVNLYECEIGDQAMIGTFVEIQKGVKIGKKCRIQSHTFVCEGVTIEDEVFIGHGVMFINDKYPKVLNKEGQIMSRKDWIMLPVTVKKGAAVGSNATILGGITIGEHSIVGAGSVVTKNVPPHTVVVGNPAEVVKNLTK